MLPMGIFLFSMPQSHLGLRAFLVIEDASNRRKHRHPVSRLPQLTQSLTKVSPREFVTRMASVQARAGQSMYSNHRASRKFLMLSPICPHLQVSSRPLVHCVIGATCYPGYVYIAQRYLPNGEDASLKISSHTTKKNLCVCRPTFFRSYPTSA
jgi:hypothetical protein